MASHYKAPHNVRCSYSGKCLISQVALRFDEHVKNILTICNQRCYLLKCLKGQGLPSAQLNIVFVP